MVSNLSQSHRHLLTKPQIVDVGAGRPLVCDRAVDADHSGLNKCTNRSDDVYKAIYAAIDDIQTKTGFAEDLSKILLSSIRIDWPLTATQ